MQNDLLNTTINVYGTVPDSIVDGPGLRYAVFVQGCSHHCPGCHNPESQPFCGGKVTSLYDLMEDIRANGLIAGVTLSGGEPFEQAESCAVLAEALKQEGYNVWCYTGYEYEELLAQAKAGDSATERLLNAIDVLIDGPFIEARKSLGLQWKGSSNQRVIDMAATRKQGVPVLWQGDTFKLEKPANW